MPTNTTAFISFFMPRRNQKSLFIENLFEFNVLQTDGRILKGNCKFSLGCIDAKRETQLRNLDTDDDSVGQIEISDMCNKKRYILWILFAMKVDLQIRQQKVI